VRCFIEEYMLNYVGSKALMEEDTLQKADNKAVKYLMPDADY